MSRDIVTSDRLRLDKRITRRGVLRSAFTAGVGVVGIALVGCGEDEETGSPSSRSSQSESQQSSNTRQEAPQQRQSRALATQEDVEQPQPTGASAQEPPPRGQARSGAAPQSSAFAAPQDVVDPLDWREWYHWRKLRALHRHRDFPPHGTLTIESAAIINWDPLASWDPESAVAQPGHMLPLVYRRLVELDVSDRSDAHRTLIQGDLAFGAEVVDATTLVFALRPGIMWPEDAPMYGRPLDAADVALSYEALREAGRRQARVYEAVDRIDMNKTDFGESVVFSLREPSAPLLNQMTSPWHVVLPAEVVSGAESVDLSQRSVGNGPFQLEQSVGRSSFVVTRNPSYDRMEFDGYPMPYLDQVRGEDYSIRNQATRDAPGSARWSAWESGVAQAIQLDGVGDVRRAREAQPDAQLQVTPPTPSGGGHFTFRSLTDGPFADVRVRAALSMALHRGSLAASVYGGLAAPDTAQNWTFFRDPQQTRYVALREWPWEEEELGEAQRYDPSRALALLSAAGYSEGHPLQFGIDMPAALNPAGDPYDPGPHRLAEFVVEQWEQHLHGVMDVRRFERSWARFTDSRSDMRFRPEANPAVDLVFRDPADVEIYDVDADDLAFGSMHSTGRFNRAGINDPEIDEWAVAQRQTLDATERVEPLEHMRLKEQEHIWRILLVNPYGVHIRRDHVLNLLGTYYAKSLHLAPDQLKRTRIGQRWGSE